MSREKPKNVAEAVTHLRRSLKLSKEKFAARVGCSFQTVMRWESNKAKNLLRAISFGYGNSRAITRLWPRRSSRTKHAVIGDFLRRTAPRTGRRGTK